MATQFYLVLSESNVDIANNQSDVTAKLYLQTTVAHSSLDKNGSITIDGTVYSFTATFPSTGVLYLLATKTKANINHNADGSKTVSVSATFDGSPTSLGVVNTSDSIVLTTIPRNSILNDISAFTFENGVYVGYTEYTTGSDLLTIKIGSTVIRSDYRLNDANNGETVQFTNDELLAIYKAITSGLSTTVTFNLRTMSGSTQIGSTSTKTATGTIRGNAKINDSGTWKNGLVYKNVGGTWKKGLIYKNVSGTWKVGD